MAATVLWIVGLSRAVAVKGEPRCLPVPKLLENTNIEGGGYADFVTKNATLCRDACCADGEFFDLWT